MHEITTTRHKDIWKYFARALMASQPNKDLLREQRLGAIGISPDGRIAVARNCSSMFKCPHGHAEARLVKKLPPFSTIFVARARKDGKIGLAAPCATCRAILKTYKAKKVYYTIDSETYGIMPFNI